MKEWCDHERDPETGGYGYWRNPNTKWDWWSIGGRWHGMLQHRPDADVPDALEGRCNQCRVKDLDLQRMLEDARQERAEGWDESERIYLKQRCAQPCKIQRRQSSWLPGAVGSPALLGR